MIFCFFLVQNKTLYKCYKYKKKQKKWKDTFFQIFRLSKNLATFQVFFFPLNINIEKNIVANNCNTQQFKQKPN